MAESRLNLDVRPSKVARHAPDWNRCLCHVRMVSEQLTPFTKISWSKLKESAEARQDEIYTNLSGHWDESPVGSYHRSCYQTYTNKTLINRLHTTRGHAQCSTTTASAISSTPSGDRARRSSDDPSTDILA